MACRHPRSNAHAVELVRSLVPRLAADGIEIDRAVLASGARVALAMRSAPLLGRA